MALLFYLAGHPRSSKYFSFTHAINLLTSCYAVVCHNNVLYYLINPDSGSLSCGQHWAQAFYPQWPPGWSSPRFKGEGLLAVSSGRIVWHKGTLQLRRLLPVGVHPFDFASSQAGEEGLIRQSHASKYAWKLHCNILLYIFLSLYAPLIFNCKGTIVFDHMLW